MKRKIFVFVCTLVMTLTAITVPYDIIVEATDGGGDYPDPDLDHKYIYERTKELSEIVEDEDYTWRSREFGEPGERQAADDIEGWMENLSLYNISEEPIDAFWNHNNYSGWEGGDSWNEDYLNIKRQFEEDDYILEVTVTNRFTQEKTVKNIVCFPLLKGNYLGSHYIEKNNVKVVEYFLHPILKNQILLIDPFWTKWAPQPWAWMELLRDRPIFYRPRLIGFILVGDRDANPDTRFMGPSGNDWKKLYNKISDYKQAGFSVSYNDGKWIRDHVINPVYKVEAYIKSKWEYEKNVESYNVIGQINGTDTDTVSIVGAHYDCWWDQGTIDEAAETALVLGIAKYIQDKNLTLKHTVKFIAFGGEEASFRGSKDYVVDHPNENIKYVINPGNFGHEDRGYYWLGQYYSLTFNTPSDNKLLRDLAKRIIDALEYTYRTGIETNCDISELEAEDSKIFSYTDHCEGAIQFSRWPFKGYHRDGLDHAVGDVMDILDNVSFENESEVVASVALHCTVDSEHRFENVSLAPYDSCDDGKNDSVMAWFNITTDTNTSLFGRVKGCLYDSNNNKVGSEKESELYMLEKNETENGYLNFCLPYNYSCGDYTVRLKVMDYWDDVDDVYNGTVYLCPYGEPIADFDYTNVTLKNFSFYDKSTPSPNGSLVSWNWNFGDGNYSSQQNTSHTYNDSGTYNVTLTVCDSNNKSDNITKSLYAKNAVPKASFYAAGSNVQIVGNSVSFTSTSSDSDGTIVDWSWDFGDGNTAGTEMAENSYSNSGLYTVDLTVTDDDGSIDTITTTMVIVGAMSDDNAEDDPDNHTWNTVQEAINDNDVQDGDIVYVYNGSYYEGITVNKSVSLFGEDKGQVTIQSMGTVVDIISDSMCMDGFTVAGGNTDVLINGADNCTITNCIVSDSFNGIKINSGSDNNTISQCNFTNNSYGVFISGSYNWIGSQSMEQLWDNCYFNLNTYGIYIDNSNDNMIVGCNINATPDPSSLGITYGICLDDSENNTIIFCNVSKASNGYGIYLDDSNQNYICHNLIFENDHGVFLSSSSDNRVAMNNISNNDISGVFIIMMSSSNNSVHWNDFIRNGHGIYPQAFDDGSGNHWNTSGNETLNYISAGEGNYWSDYNGVDNDGDGIGDTPYSIAGTANAVDSYPVMKANEFFE